MRASDTFKPLLAVWVWAGHFPQLKNKMEISTVPTHFSCLLPPAMYTDVLRWDLDVEAV